MSGLNSDASKIAIKELLFLGCLITELNVVYIKFVQSKAESYFDKNNVSIGVALSINEVLLKFDLFQYFESWFNLSAIGSKSFRGTHGLSFVTLTKACVFLRLHWKIRLSNDFGP